jgi:hypothetical protein
LFEGTGHLDLRNGFQDFLEQFARALLVAPMVNVIPTDVFSLHPNDASNVVAVSLSAEAVQPK